jgi:tyrosyl-tRNA synthetase
MTALPAPLDELSWRGLLYQYTETLSSALTAGPVKAYAGFDPTAPSLHVGNLMPIMGLLHLQRAGHAPIVLVGGGTGLIGDPSGRSAERPLVSEETVEENTRLLKEQLSHFLDFDGPTAATMSNNADWLRTLGAVEFMRDVGKHFTVNYMTAKESVKSRLEEGISYTEFSYMLLQAYDYLELYRREGVRLQLGGSEQWGNIVAGIELIRKTLGGEAHALTLPLITTSTGAKFGKSVAGAIWLDPRLTSPFKFHQFWINTDDRDAGRYLRYFTLLRQDEIEELERLSREQPEHREAQRALARDVTTRVHGAEASLAAEEVAGLLFGKGDTGKLSEGALALLAGEVPTMTISSSGNDGFDTLELFATVLSSSVKSRGAARRLLEQGGLSVNSAKLGAGDRAITRDRLLHGKYLLLKKGAREYGLAVVANDD